MSTHRDECSLEPVKCPFEAEGCKTRVFRKDFDNHMATQTQHHMLLLKKECHLIKAESDSLRKAISENVAILLKTSTMDQKGPLQSIQTVLDEPHLIQLKRGGDSLTIEIPDLSQYKRSGRVWRSPPFYIKEGYKVCLAVYPNGTGKGEGTYISLSLVLMKGEFDDQLEWPIRCDLEDCNEFFLQVVAMSKQPQFFRSSMSTHFDISGLNRVHDNQVVQSGKIILGALARVELVYCNTSSESEIDFDLESAYDDD